jgi:hypothetical protein
MKVIDALLMKLAEETAELSGVASDAGKMCSKAIRFGMDSYHPDDVTRTSNELILNGLVTDIGNEFHDVQIFNWLINFYQQIHLRQIPLVPADKFKYQDVTKRIFRDETGLSMAVMKLDQYARLSVTMVEKRTMSSAEHLELTTCIANARAFLMSIKEEPFEL